jgi:hypothetical protein
MTPTSVSMMSGRLRNSIVPFRSGLLRRLRITSQPSVQVRSAHSRNVPSWPPQNAAYT